MNPAVTNEATSPGGRRLSRSFHSCLRGADTDEPESGTLIINNHFIILREKKLNSSNYFFFP